MPATFLRDVGARNAYLAVIGREPVRLPELWECYLPREVETFSAYLRDVVAAGADEREVRRAQAMLALGDEPAVMTDG